MNNLSNEDKMLIQTLCEQGLGIGTGTYRYFTEKFDLMMKISTRFDSFLMFNEWMYVHLKKKQTFKD